MEIKNKIKKILCDTCILFTVIIIFYMLMVAFVNVDGKTILLDATRVLLFLVFSGIISLANFIFSLKSISRWCRILVHYLLSAFAFYTCLMLPINPTGSNVVVGLSLFSILYFFVVALVSFFKSRYQKQDGVKKQEYTRKFSK